MSGTEGLPGSWGGGGEPRPIALYPVLLMRLLIVVACDLDFGTGISTPRMQS